MKKTLFVTVCGLMVLSLAVLGCAQKAANSSEAIQQAQAKETVEQKVDYLISQANAFINSEQFEDAIKTARYILSNLDQNSTAAQDIIEKAKAEMQKAAGKMMEDAQEKLGSFGQ